MTIGERINIKRKDKFFSLTHFAEKVGISKQTLYKYEKGIVTNIPLDKIVAIAEALDTTPAYLMGWEDEFTTKKLLPPTTTGDFVTFPVMGEIAAGYDNLATEDWDRETVTIFSEYLKGRPESDYFVLEVKGDSMFPEYRNGDKVLILKQSTLDYSGQVGAVIYDDTHATLKKVEYKTGEDWMNLVPVNPSVQTQRIEGEALEHCKVLGVPRLLIREIKQ